MFNKLYLKKYNIIVMKNNVNWGINILISFLNNNVPKGRLYKNTNEETKKL